MSLFRQTQLSQKFCGTEFFLFSYMQITLMRPLSTMEEIRKYKGYSLFYIDKIKETNYQIEEAN